MRILVGVTSPDNGRAEIDLIASLGLHDVELALVNVIDYIDVVGFSGYGYPAGNVALGYLKSLEEDGAEALRQAAAHARERGFGELKQQQIQGYVANELMGAAEKWDVDMIGLASRADSRLTHLLYGSTVRKLVVGARQSLLLARGGAARPWRGRAVLAVDHSEYTSRCIDYLLKLAPTGLSTVRLLTAVPPKQMEKMRGMSAQLPVSAAIDIEAGLTNRNAALAKRLEPLGCKIEPVVVVDDVHAAIGKAMEEEGGADLLILGAQGHGFLERLKVGSTSLHQATHADYPILLLRPSLA